MTIIQDLIPVCPDCRCVMRWAAGRLDKPRAECRVCHKAFYYSPQGDIVLRAKLREASLPEPPPGRVRGTVCPPSEAA